MRAVLTCEHLSVRYAGNVALSDVAIDVPSGTMVGLVGANGAGKSTLSMRWRDGRAGAPSSAATSCWKARISAVLPRMSGWDVA
jgi:ATPase subunit of ABC transporter with duplicated ATPase domains